ncbi:MAG: FAD-linked oxidase [Leptospiraceae bacterium]|nr:MAG: FAD-linked oxidase [Leptospiraceae bacterium]
MQIDLFVKEVSDFLDKNQILLEEDEVISYSIDRTKDFEPKGSVVLFPKTTEEVQKIVLLANQYHIPIVPSGGRTGYSGGAVASNNEVILSLSKMNQILDFDSSLPAITCEAGVITKQLQEYVIEKGFYFPFDFASSYSSQIGGNIATHAGGIRVIRYGLLRNWVLGLEVVTGKGDILTFSGKLIKNNTGYDLKQLFIGSEGTLGIITKATLLLTKKPEDSIVFFIALENFNHVIECLKIVRKSIQPILCFEVFDSSCMNLVCNKHNLNNPFNINRNNVWYVLIEAEIQNEKEEIPYSEFIELIYPISIDILYSTKDSVKKGFFRYREDISEAVAMSGRFHKNDVAVPMDVMESFIKDVRKIVIEKYKEYQLFLFGHLGDGNIHVNLLTSYDKGKEEFKKEMAQFDFDLYTLIKKYKGSISAEHGIGLLKKSYLSFSRSKEEIEYMKQIKNIFDPNHILNPGKIFDL